MSITQATSSKQLKVLKCSNISICARATIMPHVCQYIHIYDFSNLYIPDSVSLASLAHQLLCKIT